MRRPSTDGNELNKLLLIIILFWENMSRFVGHFVPRSLLLSGNTWSQNFCNLSNDVLCPSLLNRSLFHNRIQPGSLIADVDYEPPAVLLFYFAEKMEEEPCWFLLYLPWTKEASKLDPGSLGSISEGNTTARTG